MVSALNKKYYGVSFIPGTIQCSHLSLAGFSIIKNVRCENCVSVGFWVGLRSLFASEIIEFTGTMISYASISAPTVCINYDIGFKADKITGKNITICQVKEHIGKNNIVTKILRLFVKGKYKKYFYKEQAYINNIQGEEVYLENCAVETVSAKRVVVHGNCEIKKCNAQYFIRMEQ